MRFRPSAVLALSAAVLTAACTETPLDPTPSDLQPSFARVGGGAGQASSSTKFFVVSTAGALPESFAEAVAAAGATVDAHYADLGVAVVSNLDDRGARSLRRVKGVGFVEPEPMFYIDEPVSIGEPETVGIQSPADPAGAFFYARQWNMRAIEADVAWAAGRLGSSDVTVAILDTGIDYLHADLAGRVDLNRSVSFVPDDDVYVNAFFPGRHLITDIGFHGTHVAATVVSNGLAAAGVTSGVTLIGAKVCSVALGFCPGAAVFAGILHAVESGAAVANMSLGGSFSKREFPGAVSAYQRLFNWAQQSGTTFVVSAGNSAFDLDHDKDGFKTYCTVANVVCVSATGPTAAPGVNGPWTAPDAPAVYSNYGRSSITVAAPGGNRNAQTGYGSWVYAACSSSSLVIPVCQTGTFIVGVRGTSMAAPHVSGVAALIAEDVGPNPAQIRARLEQSADDLGQPGVDPFYGNGRLNAAAAVGVN